MFETHAEFSVFYQQITNTWLNRKVLLVHFHKTYKLQKAFVGIQEKQFMKMFISESVGVVIKVPLENRRYNLQILGAVVTGYRRPIQLTIAIMDRATTIRMRVLNNAACEASRNKKDGYRQQNVRQRQKLISIIDYDVCMTSY